MIQRAGRANAGVALASPVVHPPRAAQAAWSSRAPAARWMAPSTPPPPASASLAALTTASTASVVMSPRTASTLTVKHPGHVQLAPWAESDDDHTTVITSVPHPRE